MRYVILRAARALGVAPWEMEKQPTSWMQWALMVDEVENEVRPILENRAEMRRKAGR